MKTALITGITGQDGSYLAEFLLEKGYRVIGVMRRSSSFNTGRIDPIVEKYGLDRIRAYYGDLTDSSNLNRILKEVKPDEIYNLAAQSHVQVSFEVPEYTGEVDGLGTIRLLDAIRDTEIETKFYQASTSELYGKVQEVPQSETTPFYPRSPYGCAKLYAFWIVKNYREAYNLFACNGILFNHESPRRGETFVTRKITQAAAKIKLGYQDKLEVGNLNAKRDWGYAPEYVEGMWQMLQQPQARDYVLATGETHTVREFIELAFLELGMVIGWEGTGIKEKGILQKPVRRNKKNNLEEGQAVVVINPRYHRPAEVDLLLGDATKAKNELGWEPKTKFTKLVKIMTQADFKNLSRNGVHL